MDIEYNEENKFAHYSEDQLNDLIEKYVAGKLDEKLSEDFEELMYLNDDVYEKVRIAEAIIRVGKKYSDELFADIVKLNADEKRKLYRQRIEEDIKNEEWDDAKELCEEALESWPHSDEFEQLLFQAETAIEIRDLSMSGDDVYLLESSGQVLKPFSLSSIRDSGLEYELPNERDISIVTQSRDMIWTKSLSLEHLFISDAAAVRSSGGDEAASEFWDEEPSVEEELIDGKILLRIYRGNKSGKLRISLKTSL